MENEAVLETLESRLRDNPKSLLFARLADAYLEQGKIDDGMILCAEGVKHHPYYSTGYFVLAKAHLLKKEYDKAESALKIVLSHDQQYLAAHKMLADVLVKTGWEATAVDHYSAVLEIDPFEEKVRDLLKRYSFKSEPKTPLLKPSEDPSAAVEEEFPAVELKPPAPSEDEPEAAVPAETQRSLEMEPEFSGLPDWTDEIKEFHPDDGNPPVAGILTADAFEKQPKTASSPDGEEQAKSSVTEPDQKFFNDGNVSASTALQPDSDVESVREDEIRSAASREELVDFTQDWFDLSSFETVDEESSREEKPGEPPHDIVQAVPIPAEPVPSQVPPAESFDGPLFEKDQPREILAPSDLLPPASEEPPPPPHPARMKPAVHPPASPPRRTTEFRQPRKTGPTPAEEPKSREVKTPPVPSKAEDKSEAKIVTSTLGEIYAVQGQFDKAIQVYEALLEKTPGDQKYLDKIADLKKKLRESSGK